MMKYYDYRRTIVLTVSDLIKQIADKTTGTSFYSECLQPDFPPAKYSDFVANLVEAWRRFCSEEFFELNYSADYVLAVKDNLDDAESVVFVCSKEAVKKSEEVA